jgi:PAS domain S-box-containing protein
MPDATIVPGVQGMTASEVDELRQKIATLRHELLEAEETISAIHDGRVDAFVVGGSERDRVYMLESIEGPFRILVERMQQGAVTVSPDGAILYVNYQFAALLGRPRERLVGLPFRSFIVWADRPLFDAIVANEITRPQGELRLEHANGTLVSVYVSAGALASDNGGDVCLLVTDLTQQKKHEELIAAETLARSMLEQAADAVVVCDPEGIIVLASPAAHELCGRNPLRQRFVEMFPLILDDRLPCAPNGRFALDRLDSRIRGLQASLQCADVTPMRLLLSASMVRDVQGEPLGSVITITDISALKRAEDELKQADRRKDEFLATLAHELRNPLAPIVSGLEVLSLGAETTATSGPVLDMMGRQVGHLVRLVDDLLEVSRITRGKIELRKEVVDFEEVLTHALDTSRPCIEAARHSLRIDVPAEAIRLEADGVRLAQVISNLLNNAAKYTPPGGDIGLVARMEDGGLVIRVSDTGYGIPAESIDDVFEMFSQSGRDRSSESGLGIGLALVRTLVQMHGGSVSVVSEGHGRGSEFTVRLPIGNVPQGDDIQVPRPDDRGSTMQRVLVVDDNRDSANSLGMLLDVMDYDVKVAFDGASALEQLDEFRAEAVFLDIDMPGMDGYEVARRIRQRADLEDVVLVAVTGWNEGNDRAASKDAAFDHYLLKPVEIESLRAVLSTTG